MAYNQKPDSLAKVKSDHDIFYQNQQHSVQDLSLKCLFEFCEQPNLVVAGLSEFYLLLVEEESNWL